MEHVEEERDSTEDVEEAPRAQEPPTRWTAASAAAKRSNKTPKVASVNCREGGYFCSCRKLMAVWAVVARGVEWYVSPSLCAI